MSFGLKPAIRHVLNSVFLHECREAGLDAAIVHAARIMPMHKIDDHVREVTLDLDLRPPPRRLRPAHRAHGAVRGRRRRRGRAGGPLAAGRSSERLKHRIIDGDRDGLEADLDEQLATLPALAIVNDVLLEGMKVVGELFGRGEMQLPFVLQSAETMKTAVAYLEPHMEKADAGGKGGVVLGTVKGDVHDIGKNLVDIILTNNGYKVHNIGIKAPLADVRREGHARSSADAIGMSGLLVKSTLIMRENLEELNDAGPRRDPGAARRRRAHPHLRGARPARGLRRPRVLRQGRVRGPAHDGPRSWRASAAGALDPEFGRALGGRDPAAAQVGDGSRARRRPRPRCAPTSPPTCRSSRRRSSAHASPRASRSTRSPRYINETALFRNQWQFRPDKTHRRDRRRVQGAHPPDAARAARRGQGRGLARARRGRGATSR